MNKKLLTAVVVSTVALSSLVLPFSANAAVEDDINKASQKISDLSSKKDAAQGEIASITDKIAVNEEDATKLVAEMKTTQSSLKTLTAEISALNTKIAQREDKLKEQARTIQVNGDTQNYLDFVLSAESVGDVIGRVDVVTQMVSANQDLVKEQKSDKDAVATKQKETEKKSQEQTVLAAKLEAAKADLDQQKLSKEAVVASLASEKASAESEKASFLTKKEEAEKAAAAIAAAKTAPVVAAQTSVTTKTSETEKASTPAASTPETPASSEENKPAATNPAPNAGGVLGAAYSVSGTPYLYGGTTTAGFDCSGFTQYAFAAVGVSLPRTASAQYSATSRVSQAEAQPGDLVFFNQTGSIDHVAIYLGGGQFIGSQSSTGVAVASISPYYWAQYLVGFGRVN